MFVPLFHPQSPPAPVTFASLVHELEDLDARARFPDPPYQALRATSYNRESVAKDKPGWFADSDGSGFLREETNSGRHEWVIQEQQGPGCLTKFWTPYFYRDLDDHVGPNVRIYLDGAAEPMLELPLIELVTQNDWPRRCGERPKRQEKIDVLYSFGGFTARAGNFYMPIAFAKGCKVTLDKPPFYYAVDSRSYPAGTAVQTTTRAQLLAEIERRVESGCAAGDSGGDVEWSEHGPRIELQGPRAVAALDVQLDPAEIAKDPALLRRLVLRATFDRESCIECPLGDFFGDTDKLHGFLMRARSSTEAGLLHCAWPMPFRESATIEIVAARGAAPAKLKLGARTKEWEWDERSMHFHATWRPDELVAGDHFEDWNFLDVSGQGVLVGDQWTVLNATDGWWGEGDEKIYVDASVERGFPDHFGTGTEDYYGWAGGVYPTRADRFTQPLLANICVGSTEKDSTRGFNILARDRALDAIPFRSRLVFDMEASPGVDQRKSSDRIGYSSVTYWYGRPGAKDAREKRAR